MDRQFWIERPRKAGTKRSAAAAQDGSQFFASTLITQRRDAGGSITGYLVVIRDVTERAAQDALRQTNATLWGMLQAVPLPVMSVDREGKVSAWNPASQHVFGWSAEEVMGKVLPTIPADKQENFRQILQNQWEGKHINGIEVEPGARTVPGSI